MYVASGKISSLQHKFGDNSVELGAFESKALRASAEFSEVFGRLGYDTVEKTKYNATGLI